MNENAEAICYGLLGCTEIKGCDFEIDYENEVIKFNAVDRYGGTTELTVNFIDVNTTSNNNIIKGLYLEFLSSLY